MKKIIIFLLTFTILMLSIHATSNEQNIEVSGHQGELAETVYSFDLSWGEMNFTYSIEEIKKWNPDTLQYSETNEHWIAKGNEITIINHSNATIYGEFSYEPLEDYQMIEGTFSESNVVVASAKNTSINQPPKETIVFELSGNLSQEMNGKVGMIHLQISPTNN